MVPKPRMSQVQAQQAQRGPLFPGQAAWDGMHGVAGGMMPNVGAGAAPVGAAAGEPRRRVFGAPRRSSGGNSPVPVSKLRFSVGD